MEELIGARNKAIHVMIRRFHEMKPQEVIAAVGVLEGEMAARKVNSQGEPETKKKTREEMIRLVQPEKRQAAS